MLVRGGVAAATLASAYAAKRLIESDILSIKLNVPVERTPTAAHARKPEMSIDTPVPSDTLAPLESVDDSALTILDVSKKQEVVRKLIKHIRANEKLLNENCKQVLEYAERSINRIAVKPSFFNPMRPTLSFFDTFYPVGESFDESDSENYDIPSLETILTQLLRVLQKISQHIENGKYVYLSPVIYKDLATVLTLQYSSKFTSLINELLVGKIASNFASHDEIRAKFVESKLFHDLTKWEGSQVSMRHLIGHRMNHNADPCAAYQIPDGVYQADTPENPEIDVVFVHGLNGSAFYTWRPGERTKNSINRCWPTEWLRREFRNSRVILLDFEAPSSSSVGQQLSDDEEVSIDRRGEQFLKKLRQIGVGERPTVFIGHSMGGLVIKKILVSAQSQFPRLISNTQGIVFLSTPHFGSPIVTKAARFPKIFVPSRTVLEMDTGHSNLLQLNYHFMKLMLSSDIKCLSLAESLPTNFGFGVSFTVVPLLSAYPGCGRFIVLKANHVDICKPRDRDDILYTTVRDFIKEQIPQPPPTVEEHSLGYLNRELNLFDVEL